MSFSRNFIITTFIVLFIVILLYFPLDKRKQIWALHYFNSVIFQTQCCYPVKIKTQTKQITLKIITHNFFLSTRNFKNEPLSLITLFPGYNDLSLFQIQKIYNPIVHKSKRIKSSAKHFLFFFPRNVDVQDGQTINYKKNIILLYTNKKCN